MESRKAQAMVAMHLYEALCEAYEAGVMADDAAWMIQDLYNEWSDDWHALKPMVNRD